MMMRPKQLIQLFKDSSHEYSEDKVPVLGAALSYYTIFSLAPLGVITIGALGLFYGEQAGRGQVMKALSGSVGPEIAKAIESMISQTHQSHQGAFAAVVGLIALLLGASGVFTQLQDSLNMIWKVSAGPCSGWRDLIRRRFLTFAMVLSIGFLLLVSMIASAALGALGKFLASSLPGGEAVWQLLNFAISFGVITSLFAMMFKVLPDVIIRWRDVWVGASFTSLMFTLGKMAIGLYLGKSGVASAFGAASSLVLLLVWVYYSAQIVFFGAEVTKVYAKRFGSGIKAREGAVLLNQTAFSQAKAA